MLSDSDNDLFNASASDMEKGRRLANMKSNILSTEYNTDQRPSGQIVAVAMRPGH